MNSKSKKMHRITTCVIFSALTAILAQIEIPLPIIPISGQTLAVGITATILGSRLGAIAMICYVLIGAVGVPVFAGFSGGLQVLAGPSGGYIMGFILAAFATGMILEKTRFNYLYAVIANTVGMFITLVFGTIQMKYVLDFNWQEAMLAGVYPFIIVGFIKVLMASWIGIIVRNRLIHANLMVEKIA
ncbi:biotin transporter BioY [Virgibacillus salexigens]|uniref:biotin transporter BioY n=1 Tax=Virgibacillus salexigens TaxID=61016 RepID=UPI00190C9D1D|nr:biotin transporter BioY [Virgibacillus salexigens]